MSHKDPGQLRDFALGPGNAFDFKLFYKGQEDV